MRVEERYNVFVGKLIFVKEDAYVQNILTSLLPSSLKKKEG